MLGAVTYVSKDSKEVIKIMNDADNINMICLDCGERFTSNCVIWATLDAYGPADEALCPGCENGNIGRDDSPKGAAAALTPKETK